MSPLVKNITKWEWNLGRNPSAQQNIRGDSFSGHIRSGVYTLWDVPATISSNFWGLR